MREWPALDFSGIATTGRLIRFVKMLERELDEVLSPFGLRVNDMDIIAALRRAGGAIPLVQLGRELTLSSSTMTVRVDHLERLGYVSRRAIPGDRRLVGVALTPKGRGVLKEIVPSYSTVGRESLSHLGPKQRELLDELSRALLGRPAASDRTARKDAAK